ncbi:MAG: EF-P lysine aminoacylase GenX [Victivallales bacterium]|nr:EF-P lysine aminoacylase GenX [Victivallales bacterium]
MSIKPDIIRRLEAVRPRLAIRAGLISTIRAFFSANGFLELNTPVVIKAPAPEEYIEAPPGGGGFLRSSPELEMKCMLAAGYEKIFQIGACFRQGEYGRKHRPEFTMLEWYECGAGYMDLARFTENMLCSVAHTLCGGSSLQFNGHNVNLTGAWEYLSVGDAFNKYAGTDMYEALKNDSFDELMVLEIEPRLGLDRPVFLFDYPAERAALARLKPDNENVAERWELYVGGLELANAFSELTCREEQRRRFAASRTWRAAEGYAEYPQNDDFFAALDYGIPESSGCALGIDRLAMVFCDADDISEVTFPVDQT